MQEEEENKTDNTIPRPDDPLLEKVKNTFFSEYFPIATYKPGVIFMSTQDIYNLFFKHNPNPLSFSSLDIAKWMHEQGFSFVKMKEMEYEWMLNPSTI